MRHYRDPLLHAALLWTLLHAGCLQDRTEPDRDAWLQSAASESVNAVAPCAAIASDDLRGDCQVDAARRLAAGGHRGAAMALCDEIELPVWGAECWFLVADTLALTGPEAIAACAHTGHFHTQCLNHAVRRVVDALPPELNTVGRERKLLVMVGRAVDDHHVDASPPRRQQLRQMFAANLVAERWSPDEPIDIDRCGTAPSPICRDAVRRALDLDPTDPRLQAACTRSLEDAMRSTGRTWTERTTPYVRATLHGVCREAVAARERQLEER